MLALFKTASHCNCPPVSKSRAKRPSATTSSLYLYPWNPPAPRVAMARDRHQRPQVRVLNINTQVLRERTRQVTEQKETWAPLNPEAVHWEKLTQGSLKIDIVYLQ